jgi:phosphate transport system permease protein
MTTTAIRPEDPTPPAPASPEPALTANRSHLADRAFGALTLVCGITVLAVLALIAIFTTNKAFPAFRAEGLGFVTSRAWNPTAAHPHFGGLAFIYGTLAVSLIALVVAVPVSLGMALFLTEVAPRRLRLPVVYLIDLMAAIPSVVFGLWGLLALVKPLGHFYGHASNVFAGIPLLDRLVRGTAGRSFFTAGLIVAMMITPIITSLTREVFATVPPAQKEAALALGATRWEMMRTSILGYGRSGVVGAVMLGLGRAMGETIAVALVIGSIPSITASLFHPGDAMAAVIANNFGESSGTFQAALIGLGVVLFAVTIVINIVARTFVARTERAMGKA